VLGVIVLKEMPSGLQIIGGLLILTGIGLASLAEYGNKEPMAITQAT
jgi:drug/metabolite transporter (DMT)-like permease